jgi:hypothetical protein
MTPHETEYIGADHLPSHVFRLQLCGGPYIPRIPFPQDFAIRTSQSHIMPRLVGK